MKKYTRRRFLATAGAAASVAMFGPSLFNSDIALAGPFMRRDIGGLTATDPIIVGYRNAVTAMKLLPATDRRSWSYQAAIHGTYTMPVKTAWNTCTHHDYFFWSWHRMYLYWFERIVRKYSGSSSWSLPYWNYSLATQRQIPSMFRDTTSELYVAARSAGMNGGGSLPASHVNVAPGLALVPFNTASDTLESNPHDNVHVDVGGFSGWMGDVKTAAQDPIFYLHHANMDRLWNIWLAQGGGRTAPLSDSTWKNTKFTFFDENNKQVTMTSCNVLRATDQLSYMYEGEPTQVKQYCPLKIVFPPWLWQEIILIRWPGPPVELGPERISIPFEIKDLRKRLATMAENKMQTLQLKLDGVEADKQPGVVWEVYVGLPPNAEPDPEGPYFVGTVSLFSDGIRKRTDHAAAGHKYKPASFAFTVDRALGEVLKGNDDKLQITMVPSGILVDGKPTRPRVESKVRIGQLTLAIKEQKKGRQ